MNVKESPPGRAEASGSNAGDRRNNERDNQLLPDQGLLGNIRRRLINAQSGAPDAWEVFTLSVHYEVQTADQKWTFTEKWEAILQQVKIANALAERRSDHVS